MQQFLTACNVNRQHSATLESYLIKPVQRVLRYPLFLQQIKSLTSQGAPENVQISEALTKMEKVAEYINEMQRIYEEYGFVFCQAQTLNKSLKDVRTPTVSSHRLYLLNCRNGATIYDTFCFHFNSENKLGRQRIIDVRRSRLVERQRRQRRCQ